jgi:hypothetical protein
MKRLTLALGSILLCAATAWAAAPPAAAPAPASLASPAVFAPLATELPGNAQPVLTFVCPPEPVTSCNSCLYFGIPSNYQCTIYCANGVPHRSCNICGEGCDL